MSEEVQVVIDADGKISAWYIVQPENVGRIVIPADHFLIVTTRRPYPGETHIDQIAGAIVASGDS